MTLPIVKTTEARASIWRIVERIAVDDALAASQFALAVDDTLAFLSEFPASGDVVKTRKKGLKGLRIWQVKGFENYAVLFRATPDRVEILLVFHAARNLATVLRELGRT